MVAFAGGIADGAQACHAAGIDAFFPAVRGVTTLEEAMRPETAAENLAAAAEQVFRLVVAATCRGEVAAGTAHGEVAGGAC